MADACAVITVNCNAPCPTGNGSPTPPVTNVTGFTQTIGDGVAVSFIVAHNLGSSFVIPSIRHVPSGEVRTVSPVVAVIDDNSVRVDFSTPPGLNEYAVYILAFHANP